MVMPRIIRYDGRGKTLLKKQGTTSFSKQYLQNDLTRPNTN